MKKKFELSIPKSCHENWENFESRPEGGYCGACQKTVIDFTQMTDLQILNFIESNTGGTCGRFRSSQLKTYEQLTYPVINSQSRLFRAGIAAMTLFLFSAKPAWSQKIPEKTEQLPNNTSPTITTKTKSADPKITVKGTVTTEGEPMPGVNVFVKGAEHGTIADMDGHFQLDNLKAGDKLVFSFIGYEPLEYKVEESSSPDTNIQLVEMNFRECDYALMGEIQVDQVYEPKHAGIRNFWNKVVNIF